MPLIRNTYDLFTMYIFFLLDSNVNFLDCPTFYIEILLVTILMEINVFLLRKIKFSL